MVALSVTSVNAGYDGTVDETQLAALLPRVGACEYGVDGDTDFQVSAASGVDRTVRIRAGRAWGHSVIVDSDSEVTVQLPVVASGSRWDLIVLRRDWQPSQGVSSVQVLQGSSDRAQSALAAGSRETRPGVVDDQPLALVRVTAGSSLIAEIVDMRVWARNGGAFAVDTLALGYLAKPGSRVRIAGLDWGFVKTGATFGWSRIGGGRAIPYNGIGGTGWAEPAGGDGLLKTLDIADPGFPYTVQTQCTVEAAGGGAGTRWDLFLRVNGYNVDVSRGDAVAPWFQLAGVYPGGLEGPTQVTIYARRSFGSGAFGLSSFNKFLTAVVLPM